MSRNDVQSTLTQFKYMFDYNLWKNSRNFISLALGPEILALNIELEYDNIIGVLSRALREDVLTMWRKR